MTMITVARVEANRENALASTGPKSVEGKAIVSHNAIRHGLLSWKPVIPGFETVEDWESHHERTLDSLAPVGYAETMLAERAERYCSGDWIAYRDTSRRLRRLRWNAPMPESSRSSMRPSNPSRRPRLG
jgi:hypothetical protein